MKGKPASRATSRPVDRDPKNERVRLLRNGKQRIVRRGDLPETCRNLEPIK